VKRSPIARRTPLRSVGRRKLRSLADERAFRTAVRERAGGECQIRSPWGPPGRHEGAHAHHVAPSDRRRGVHDPARGLWTCAECHSYAHLHPAESYRRGWLVKADGA
jgi:hypothetical protein